MCKFIRPVRAGNFLSLELKMKWKNEQKNGGGTQIRTGGKGFAVLCLTTWLYRLEQAIILVIYRSFVKFYFYIHNFIFILNEKFYLVSIISSSPAQSR